MDKPTKTQAKTRLAKLRAEINDYRYHYHVLNRSTMSEAAADSLKHELTELETLYPDLITPDSPSQRVAGQAQKQFTEVHHASPLLSLNDIFSLEEFRAWQARLQKIAGSERWQYFAELKIDGLAVSLIYERGTFVTASTRGNGLVGEDITKNIKTIEAIPLTLRDLGQAARPTWLSKTAAQQLVTTRLEVRGEVFMSRAVFANLNKQQAAAGKPLYANPRNVAAGSVRQLNPQITASRHLSFLAYDLITNLELDYHHREHELAGLLGFPVDQHNQVVENEQAVEQFLRHWGGAARQRLPYQTDGVVIGVDQTALRRSFGIIGKAPRAIVAFKFAAEEVTTTVEDIIVQVGRTGKLTPVAILKPVQVAGTTVSRATLHNADEIARKDIRIGDTVIIRKAGDIIPEVIKVLPKLRPSGTKPYVIPVHCPRCGAPVEKISGQVDYRCTNKGCFAQELQNLRHFVGRTGVDMDGLGPKILEQFLEQGLVKSPADLYRLKIGDVLPLERFAEKSAENVIAAIQARKALTLGRLLFSLGVRHVGEVTAEAVARAIEDHFKRAAKYTPSQFYRQVKTWSTVDFMAVPDIGPVVADSLTTFFAGHETKTLLKDLTDLGIRITHGQRIRQVEHITGKTFVFTGELELMSRDDAKALIRSLGAATSESVSQQTDYVVVGANPGSKAAKAASLGVHILDEAAFRRLIKHD